MSYIAFLSQQYVISAMKYKTVRPLGTGMCILCVQSNTSGSSCKSITNLTHQQKALVPDPIGSFRISTASPCQFSWSYRLAWGYLWYLHFTVHPLTTKWEYCNRLIVYRVRRCSRWTSTFDVSDTWAMKYLVVCRENSRWVTTWTLSIRNSQVRNVESLLLNAGDITEHAQRDTVSL